MKPYIIAIDGMSAALKTTTAHRLAALFQREGISAGIIHCDDFFLPKELRTPKRYEEPGGNIHYERLKEEIIEPFVKGDMQKEGVGLTYRPFDCSRMDYGTPITLPVSRVYILEGAYAMHPYLGPYYDFSLFMKVEAEEQLRRIAKRGGNVEMFREKWIPLEAGYHESCNTEERADLVVDTTAFQSNGSVEEAEGTVGVISEGLEAAAGIIAKKAIAITGIPSER